MKRAGTKFRYRRAIARYGEPVVFRRFTGAGSNRPQFNAEIRARVTGYEPKDLIGGIQQGDRRVLVLVADVLERQIAMPITTSDFIVVRGRQCAIFSLDDSTHRDGTELIALEMGVRG